MSETEHLSGDDVIIYWCVSVALVLLAGCVSGLNLAIFSIEPMQLRVILRLNNDERQCRRARRILGLLEYQHLTLVALLSSNAGLATALPIFLERLLDPVTALIVSVTAVLFFGEVIPQATFVRNAVPVVSGLSPFVWFLIVITFPVSYPVSRLLDVIVDHGVQTMEKDQLEAFLALHSEEAQADGRSLLPYEVSIMRGVLALSSKKVRDLPQVASNLRAARRRRMGNRNQSPASTMTNQPSNDVQDMFALSTEDILDVDLLLSKGYNRVPIYYADDQTHIVGVLIVKCLLSVVKSASTADFDAPLVPLPPRRVKDYPYTEALRVSVEMPLNVLYRAFQEGRCHMAVAYNRGKMAGIVTLDDIFMTMHELQPKQGPHGSPLLRHSIGGNALVGTDWANACNDDVSDEDSDDEPRELKMTRRTAQEHRNEVLALTYTQTRIQKSKK